MDRVVSIAVLVGTTLWSVIVAIFLLRYWTLFGVDGRVNLLLFVLVILIIVGSLIGIFLKGSLRNSIALIAVSAFLTLYAVEFVHYTLTYYPGFPDLSPPIKINAALIQKAEKNKIWIDKRSKIEVLLDLRLRGVPSYPAFLVTNRVPWDENPDLYLEEPLPLGSISKSTVVHCNESGKWSIYNSDEKGFNNPVAIWGKPEYTAILLGDSYVHGACVDPGEDLGSWIRKEYANTISLGQRGNGPILQLAGLKEYGVNLRPQYAVWFYTENNDLLNLIGESNSSFLGRYLEEDFSQNLFNRQEDVDQFVHKFTESNYKLAKKSSSAKPLTHARYILTLRSLRKKFGLEVHGQHPESSEWKVLVGLGLLESNGPSNLDEKPKNVPLADSRSQRYYHEWGQQLPKYRRVLSLAKDITESWGGKLIFVFLPNGGRYDIPDAPHWRLKEDMLEIVNELGIPIIDSDLAIGDGDHRRYFPANGGHYNGEGYRVVSEQVIALIRKYQNNQL